MVTADTGVNWCSYIDAYCFAFENKTTVVHSHKPSPSNDGDGSYTVNWYLAVGLMCFKLSVTLVSLTRHFLCYPLAVRCYRMQSENVNNLVSDAARFLETHPYNFYLKQPDYLL